MTRDAYIKENAKAYFGDNLSLQRKLSGLAGACYDSMKFKGEATNAAVAALTAPMNGDSYKIITTAGTLNTGDDEITTIVGDTVTYDEENSLWAHFASVAAINV